MLLGGEGDIRSVGEKRKTDFSPRGGRVAQRGHRGAQRRRAYVQSVAFAGPRGVHTADITTRSQPNRWQPYGRSSRVFGVHRSRDGRGPGAAGPDRNERTPDPDKCRGNQVMERPSSGFHSTCRSQRLVARRPNAASPISR